ncbi:hypothetical protein KUTeg_024477 [Tegillarca granosa]|uniref:B box-type domain-containing protein n=1 Tax=Tegillarca granosa TaxID=220873 RepID=A0ABQ9E0I2_TEGGR|nr:hypothetical protein KUTeg_024477 [Tegillarca granosa]
MQLHGKLFECRKRRNENEDENELECPECRQTVRLDQKGIDGLPKNFTLANIVQKYAKQEHKEEEKYPCDICDTEPPNDAVKSCLQCGLLYCNSCLSLVHPSKGKLKTHDLIEPSEHGYCDSIKPEDSKLIDTGGQRKKETQVVFNRLSTILKTKEQQCISEVDDEVDEKTDNLVLLLTSCQQFTEDINKLMKDAQTCVEDFPRKTTRSNIRYRKETSELSSASGMVDTHEVEEKLEALGQGTELNI